MLTSCGYTLRPSKILWMPGKLGKSGYMCLEKSLERPVLLEMSHREMKST